MMKCVLTLVFLFHLCHSDIINITLSKEIMRDLSTLGTLEINFTSPETARIRVPSTKMDKNASACVGVFVRELKHLLDNVTVPENSNVILLRLMANLEAVGNHTENDQKCPMKETSNLQKPFIPYKTILRTLIKKNSMK